MKSKNIKKRYVAIIISETDEYPKVGLSYWCDHPWDGYLVDIIMGDTREELFRNAFDEDGESYEGLFYQLFDTKIGHRHEYGVLDPASFECVPSEEELKKDEKLEKSPKKQKEKIAIMDEPAGKPLKNAEKAVKKATKEHCSMKDFSIGDTVYADGNPGNLSVFHLPAYLADGKLTVIGFTKTKVICDWDGGKPFRIPPQLLRKKICKNEETMKKSKKNSK